MTLKLWRDTPTEAYLIPPKHSDVATYCKKCDEYFIDSLFNFEGKDFYVCMNPHCNNSFLDNKVGSSTYENINFLWFKRSLGKKLSKHPNVFWDKNLKKWFGRAYIRSLKKTVTFGYYTHEHNAIREVEKRLPIEYPEVLTYQYYPSKSIAA